MKELVIVGGCGHVGLPLGAVFAHTGQYRVSLLDISTIRIGEVNKGISPFMEAGLPELLAQTIGKSLFATADDSCLGRADIVIATIGTPVDSHLNPTVHAFKKDIDRVLEKISDGCLLVLRSTLYPGVSQLVFERIKELGRKIDFCFCPERIAEGKAIEELKTLPQIISAFDPRSMDRARELFSHIAPSLIEMQPMEAELAKLFTNCWRYLNFAISNQFYILAQSNGLDFYKIYDGVTRQYPRMQSFARAGFAAGPCLLKDTLQLSAFANNNFFMGHAAMLINEGLPKFIVENIKQYDLSDKTVSILGMAFKAESDDNRDSLSYKLRHLLQVNCKRVLSSDPYVKDRTLVGLEEALEEGDILIIGAPHVLYRDLKFKPEQIVIDVWGLYSKERLTTHQGMLPEPIS